MTIQLRTLGALDLRAADGREIRMLLAQPKRLALLTYLSAAPAAFHRRDTLLALFWPESDEKSARAALRTALSVLRRALGAESLIGRGGEEIGIDPERLVCDVACFEAAWAAGDPERALDLYRGDLLAGFHLDDAPEFERWLDERRRELRGLAVRAAVELAERDERVGERISAVRWARRAAALEPDDETVLCRLIRLLDRVGDRAGALGAYGALADRLRREYDAEPAPETRAVIEAVRCREHSAQPPPEPVPTPAALPGRSVRTITATPEEFEPAAAVTPRSSVPPAGRARRLRATATRLLVVVAAMVLAAALSSLVLAPEAREPGSTQRVAVAAFENHTGDPALDPLGTMAADWISQGLMRTGQMEVVPITSVLYAARSGRRTPSLDPLEQGRALVEQTGATILVTGAFYRAGDSLQFHTRIADARTGALLSVPDPVAGPGAEPLAIVERLRSRVTGSLAARLDWRLDRVQSAASPPPTWEAYHASIRGIEAFTALRFAEARTHFVRAVELDSMYTPALLLGAVNHANVGEVEPARRLAQRLVARQDRLAPHERHLTDWLVAWLHDDHEAALRAARRAVAIVPSSEWLFVVGLSALNAHRPAEVIEAFTRPEAQRGWAGQWPPYWNVLTAAHHMRGEYALELEVARRGRGVHPQSLSVLSAENRALIALGRIADAERNVAAAWSLPAEAGNLPPTVALLAAEEMRAHGHRDSAARLVGHALQWFDQRPAAERSDAAYRSGLANALYEAGRWAEARALLEELAAEQPSSVSLRGLLGVVAARQGETAMVNDAAAWLTGTGAQHGPTGLVWRARIAASGGNADAALALLQQAVAAGMTGRGSLHTDLAFEALAAEPRFQALLRPRQE
jgi:DNA-binding SARP family transcriptional activator/TolB-like protein